MNFPKFIQDKPSGYDSLEGKSGERVAKAIENHIEKISTENQKKDKNRLPQIIGLEGEWGSGKTNVIRILKNNVKSNYYLFEYDAWGNQEDLQRRSFLEQLTEKLIVKKILNGYTELIKRGGGKEIITWEQKLKYLLARKTETVSEKYPRISNGMAVSGLVAILTPVFTFIGYTLQKQNNSWWAILISIFISVLPILASLIMWKRACKKDVRYKDVGYLLAIYNDKVENDVNYETISEKEPTVSEFKSWMKDISDFIERNNKRKLIIVFDNMDRLPDEKVKELWSSIYTFFSDECYKNIWVIIPFDRKHLSNAFGEQREKIKELTTQFIAKTFPIIYRVARPVLTDQKDIFSKFFKAAFGETEKANYYKIQRMFFLLRRTFTPRDIISFVNEIVSIKQSWLNEMPLIPISIFVLKKDELLDSNVDDFILSKNYLKGIERIIDDSDDLQNQITAITYGIDVEFAIQVPLKQYLRNTLRGDEGFDINKFAEHKHFESILEDELKEVDLAILDKAIESITKYNRLDVSSLYNIWNELINMQMSIELSSLLFTELHKSLLLNSEIEYKTKFVNYLCERFRNYKDFKGDLFFNAMDLLDSFILNNNLPIKISDYLENKDVDPETFIEYVSVAKAKFSNYKILCDTIVLDDYLSRFVPDKLPKMDFIKYLSEDKFFKFSVLLDAIEKSIAADTLKLEDLTEVVKTHKILSTEKPLPIKFTKVQVQTFLPLIVDKTSEIYYDFVAMGLCYSIDTPISDELAEKVAERIELFLTYGELLILSVSFASPLLRNSLKVMTERSLGENLEIEEVLPNFDKITVAINVDPIVLLNDLSKRDDIEDKITVDNIETLIPNYTFYTYTATNKFSLTNHINSIAIRKIESISIDVLYSQRNTPTNYWLNVISIFIQHNVLTSLTDNLIELTKLIIVDVVKGQPIPPPNGILDVIINKAHKNKLLATIKTIGEDFCNRTFVITPPQFLFFSSKFDFINKLAHKDGAIVRNIFNEVLTDQNCLNEILRNKDLNVKIVINAGLEAEDFKTNLRELLKTNNTNELTTFANEIGLNDEKDNIGSLE